MNGAAQRGCGNIGFSLDTAVLFRACPRAPKQGHSGSTKQVQEKSGRGSGYIKQPVFNFYLLIWEGGHRTQAQDISTTVTMGRR